MARKRIRISERMLFTWFMLGGLIILFSPSSVTSRFQFAFARIFRLPLSIGRNLPLSARTEVTLEDRFSRKEIQYQNYIANLEEELHRKNEVIGHLSGLRTRFRGLEGAKLVSSDIITISTEGLRSELIINRGSEDGLAKGMFVIGDNSVIGIICDLAARTAKVRLLTDAASVVEARVQGLEINMLMQGNGNNRAKIKLVPVKHKVKAGDNVLVKARPGYLDIGMIAGTIEKCQRDGQNPALWDITVKPVCDVSTLDSVAVIVMNPPKSSSTGGAH